MKKIFGVLFMFTALMLMVGVVSFGEEVTTQEADAGIKQAVTGTDKQELENLDKVEKIEIDTSTSINETKESVNREIDSETGGVRVENDLVSQDIEDDLEKDIHGKSNWWKYALGALAIIGGAFAL